MKWLLIELQNLKSSSIIIKIYWVFSIKILSINSDENRHSEKVKTLQNRSSNIIKILYQYFNYHWKIKIWNAVPSIECMYYMSCEIERPYFILNIVYRGRCSSIMRFYYNFLYIETSPEYSVKGYNNRFEIKYMIVIFVVKISNNESETRNPLTFFRQYYV